MPLFFFFFFLEKCKFWGRFISFWALGTVDLCAIKNSLAGNTLPPVLLHLRSSVSLPPLIRRSYSQMSLCFFVLVHYILLAQGVIHHFYLSLFIFSPFSLRVSTVSLLSSPKIWHGEVPAGFLIHSSSLKSKPTEAKSGYYLGCVSSFSAFHPILSSFFIFRSRSMKFNPFKRKASCSVSRMGVSWIWKEIAA